MRKITGTSDSIRSLLHSSNPLSPGRFTSSSASSQGGCPTTSYPLARRSIVSSSRTLPSSSTTNILSMRPVSPFRNPPQISADTIPSYTLIVKERRGNCQANCKKHKYPAMKEVTFHGAWK